MEEQKTDHCCKNESAQPSQASPSFSAQGSHSTGAQGKAKSDNFWKITTVVVIALLAFFAFKGGSGGNPTGGTVIDTVGNPGAAPTPPAKVDFKNLITSDDHVKGDKDAKVTIIEWSDFECPFCARFYTETLGQIDEQYIKTGKVKLIYKDFPLSFHPQAQKAAESSECAADQEKFWEMHNLLFEKGVQGGVASFKQFAKDLGLNSAKFDKCLDSGEKAGEVQKDMADGGKSGIQGTPGFLINGQLVSGAQPFTVFQQVIDAELI